MTQTPEYDVTSQDFFRDPYPTLRRMRAEAPVYYCTPLKIWMLTRHEDLEFLLKDPRFSSRRAMEVLSGILTDDEPSRQMLATWSRLLFFLDPPRHTRIRGIVNKSLTPACMDGLRPMVVSVVRDALSSATRERREIDVATEFADPIALNVITEMFAVPAEDRPQFRQWTTDVLKPAGAGVSSVEIGSRVKQSSIDMNDYMMRLVTERRGKGGTDMVSRLIAAADQDPEIAAEVSVQCFQLIGAGYLTTANQITNAVLVFLRHPDELQKLRDNPGLLRSAVEEVLRFEPSILTSNRLCTEDMEIHGTPIKKGELVFGFNASANRDPDVFPDADRFDITRQGIKHFTLGSGPHYCSGAALSRIELEEALRALLTLPRWEFGDKPYEYLSFNLQDRAPKTLPVRFPPA